LFLPLALAVAACVVATPAASAIGSFGAPKTVVASSCAPDMADADLVQDSTGRSRGYASLYGSDCNPSLVITYVSGINGSWSRVTTPYRGFPVASAWDSTGTYLLYVKYPTLGLYLAKRHTDGTFGPSTLLSNRIGPDGSSVTGDIAAYNGRWWAVWREHMKSNGSAGDEFEQTDLFQAYTFGGTLHGRSRVTADPKWDSAPTLAVTPGTGYPVRLAWTRGGSDFGTGGSTDVWLAAATTPGNWSAAAFATAGTANFWPDLAVTAKATYLTWNRDGHTVFAQRTGSVTSTHTFTASGLQHMRPRIAAFGGTIAVGWTTPSYRGYVAERSGSTWSGGYATAAALNSQELQAVATVGGRSTAVVFRSASGLYSTTES
jgi:hypothetical protein